MASPEAKNHRRRQLRRRIDENRVNSTATRRRNNLRNIADEVLQGHLICQQRWYGAGRSEPRRCVVIDCHNIRQRLIIRRGDRVNRRDRLSPLTTAVASGSSAVLERTGGGLRGQSSVAETKSTAGIATTGNESLLTSAKETANSMSIGSSTL